MTVSRESHLPQILNEWAEWYRQSVDAGFPSETVLYRMMAGQRGEGRPGWCEPAGIRKITPHGAVRRAHEAILVLMDDEDCRPMVSVCRAYYLGGMQTAMDTHMSVNHKDKTSRAATHYAIKAGEVLIAREMKLRT